MSITPELAALARDADEVMAAAGLRLPAAAPAPGQRTEDWEADVAACRAEWDAFIAALGRPASQNRLKALMGRGFHRAGDVENRLGFHVGQIGG